ncbi:MAG: hypothetical protein LBT50_00955 [Prevotellaceae bacterium]|nr:hypothetical protein [Prevotellaceae bacterium]
MKDKILEYFMDIGSINFSVNIHEVAKNCNISYDVLVAILDHFEELGFFEQKKYLSGKIDFFMKVYAYDFYSHGGFAAHENFYLLKENIENLLLEIESFKPSVPKKLDSIKSIAENISATLHSLPV